MHYFVLYATMAAAHPPEVVIEPFAAYTPSEVTIRYSGWIVNLETAVLFVRAVKLPPTVNVEVLLYPIAPISSS